jgi:hypothetical protein
VPAGERPREQQAGQVRARDQQDAHGSAEQGQEQQARALGDLVPQPHDVGAGAGQVGVLAGEPCRDDVELGVGLRDAHARPQPGDAVDVRVVALLEVALGKAHGRPDLRVP